ncbi:MAG: hypothetical protein ACN6QH_20185 [Pseudomonas sp.]|uniref:hypothetical protein n=1 Tax=Pseudomonas sp. TaxID=306 RepID=UPI003D14BF32
MKITNTLLARSVAVAGAVLGLLVSVPASALTECEAAFNDSTAKKTCTLEHGDYVEGTSLCQIHATCTKADKKTTQRMGYTFYIGEVKNVFNDDGELKVRK